MTIQHDRTSLRFNGLRRYVQALGDYRASLRTRRNVALVVTLSASTLLLALYVLLARNL